MRKQRRRKMLDTQASLRLSLPLDILRSIHLVISVLISCESGETCFAFKSSVNARNELMYSKLVLELTIVTFLLSAFASLLVTLVSFFGFGEMSSIVFLLFFCSFSVVFTGSMNPIRVSLFDTGSDTENKKKHTQHK